MTMKDIGTSSSVSLVALAVVLMGHACAVATEDTVCEFIAELFGGFRATKHGGGGGGVGVVTG